jgi:hypothetical protein
LEEKWVYGDPGRKIFGSSFFDSLDDLVIFMDSLFSVWILLEDIGDTGPFGLSDF